MELSMAVRPFLSVPEEGLLSLIHILKFLCDHGADIILRLPLIAGLNDDEAHFKAVAGLVERYSNIRRAEIMAYHNLGVSKADQIGMAGELWDQENTSAKQKEVWLRRFKDLGLTKIKIG